MRVLMQFDVTAIPISYRLGILSVIKEMVKQGSEDFYRNFFEDNRKRIKPFAYAAYIPNMKIKDDLLLGDALIVTISSPSYELMMHLLNGSQNKKVFKYKSNEWVLSNKRLLPHPPKMTSVMTFKTLSPILIEDSNNRPILAGDDLFEKEFNYYADLKANELFDRSLYQPIKIIQTAMKKQVVKEHFHQEQDKPLFFTANSGRIKLEGHPEDLKIIYDVGIGKRTSLGFGLLDIEEVTYV